MADILGFIREVFGVGAVVTALLGVAAYLGRSQLSHWLNKDIETVKSEFQKELEAEKTRHLHALEAYKVSLIAEAERAKAAQAVKTAVAIKFAEHQFTAATQLRESLVGLALSALVVYEGVMSYQASGDQASLKYLDENLENLRKRYQRYQEAVFSNRFYFDDDDTDLLQNYSLLISGIIAVSGEVRLRVVGGSPVDIKVNGVDEFLACADSGQRINFVNRQEAEIIIVLKKYTMKYLSI